MASGSIMKQQAFEAKHSDQWEQLESALGLDGKGGESADLPEADFPRAYRQLCQQLAVAEKRGYGSQLTERLNRLALAAHHRLYGATHSRLRDSFRFLLEDFPRCVREHGRFVWLSVALFFGPAIGLGVATGLDSSLTYSVLGPETITEMESMYDGEADRLGESRDSQSDAIMFGYYIYNNVSIALRTIAGGLLFGLGTLFFVVFNGVFIGAVAGHLTAAGFGGTFWPFVIGHGAFELTAIVFAGAIGFKLGAALWAPGRRTRVGALRHAATSLLPLIGGTVAFLFVAAVVEAYWSSMSWPGAAATKIAVGALLWIAVGVFIALGGRRRAA